MNDHDNKFAGDGRDHDATAELFDAKITAVVEDGGTYWYQWVEMEPDEDGVLQVMLNGREGTYDPTGPTGNGRTTELNNREVATLTLVRMQLRSVVVDGDLQYSFVSPLGSSSVVSQWKEPAYVSTTGDITLYGEQTIDGILTSNSRVLVKDQGTPANNGLYLSSSTGWSRTSDANSADLLNGAAVAVLRGTVGGGRAWHQWSYLTGGLGFTAVNWRRFGTSDLAVTGVDNQIVRLDGTNAVQNSLVTIDDAGRISTADGIDASAHSTFGSIYCGGTVEVPSPNGYVNAYNVDVGPNLKVGRIQGYFTLPNSTMWIESAQEAGLGSPFAARMYFYRLNSSTYAGLNSASVILRSNGLEIQATDGIRLNTSDTLYLNGVPGVGAVGIGTILYPGAVAQGGLVTSAGAPGPTGTIGVGATVTDGYVAGLGTSPVAGLDIAQTFTEPQVFQPTSSGNTPIVAQGQTGQTADLFQALDDIGNVLAYIAADGSINGLVDGGTW